MKNIQAPKQVKSYQGLYTDTLAASSHHERQRFGHAGAGSGWRHNAQVNDDRGESLEDYIGEEHIQTASNTGEGRTVQFNTSSQGQAQPSGGKKKGQPGSRGDSQEKPGKDGDSDSDFSSDDEKKKQEEGDGNESDTTVFKPSALKQKMNYNVISLDCQPVLKRYMKEEMNLEDEVCKQLHVGEIQTDSHNVVHLYDRIGSQFSHNPFNMKQQSKFVNKSNKMAQDQQKRRQTIKFKALTGGIATLPEEFTNLSEYDDRFEGEFSFHTLQFKNKTGILKEGIYHVKAKTASKLFYMDKRQIAKAFLISLVRHRGDNQLQVEELWLQDAVESFFLPNYRKVVTKVFNFSIVINDGNQLHRHMIQFDMPYFYFKSDQNGGKKFKKFLDPHNFNIMMQSKMSDWKENAMDLFSEEIGDDINNPKGKHIVSRKNTVIFERNYYEQTQQLFTNKKDLTNATTASTLYFPDPNFRTSEDGVYMRVDSYVIILANPQTHENLASYSFDLHDQFSLLLEAQLKGYDILRILAHNVKTFANSATDVWRMNIDLEEVLRSHTGDEWKLPAGQDQMHTINFHIDNHHLNLVVQYPKLYFASEKTGYNEVIHKIQNDDLINLRKMSFESWEGYCYQIYERCWEEDLREQQIILAEQI